MDDSTVLGKLDWHGLGSSCLCQFLSSLEPVSGVCMYMYVTLGNSDRCYSEHCSLVVSGGCFWFSGEDDLRDVILAVTSLAGRWMDFGICLGMRQSALEIIQADNPHSCNNCLSKMLSQWLRQGYKVCTMLILQSSPHFIYITLVWCLKG